MSGIVAPCLYPTPTLEGLATALYAQLEASGLPFNMTYQAWLTIARRDGAPGHYHYAVMSLLAAEHFVSQHPERLLLSPGYQSAPMYLNMY